VLDTRGIITTRSEAARELLRRRHARTSVVDYARYTKRGYVPADLHFQIGQALDRVVEGDCKRLMISVPPRHGKTELSSIRLSGYFLGRYPERNIISAAYNSDRGKDVGGHVRDLMAGPEHGALFPDATLRRGSTARDRLMTICGGQYMAGGVGTAMTGRGAHLMMIDDPFKDRAEADSENQRNKVYNWYLSTAYTRLERTLTIHDSNPLWRDLEQVLEDGAVPFEGAIVLIMTRWHADDLMGRLERDMERGGDQWEVINIPGIRTAEVDGKKVQVVPWPEKIPLDVMLRIKGVLNEREWNSLYQGDPTPAEGVLMKRDAFKRYSKTPENVRWYLASDWATKEDTKADFTAHIAFGVDVDGNVFLDSGYHEQTETDVSTGAAMDLDRTYGFNLWFGEGGPIENAIGPWVRKAMQRRSDAKKGRHIPRETIPSITDKVVKNKAFRGLLSSGLVYVRDSRWGDKLIDELVAFSAGKHDDQVDACSLVGLGLDMILDAERPPEQRKRGVVFGSREWLEHEEREAERMRRAQQRSYV